MAASSSASVDRVMLHRCCVQFSAPLTTPDEVAAEKLHALNFVRRHAGAHSGELARALVWRVVDTDDGSSDRRGSWELLHSVLVACGGGGELARTPLADKVLLYLPHLIEHRWYSAQPRVRTGAEGEGDGEGAREAVAPLAAMQSRVVPASLVTGYRFDTRGAREAAEQERFFASVLADWRGLWRQDLYHHLKERARSTERGGNRLTAKAAEYLRIPSTFRDSLWRLRRRDPRPSIAFHVLRCYGCDALPATVQEAAAAEPAMHPAVRRWLARLVEKRGGCRLCETWLHTEDRCPCETPFLKPPLETESGEILERRAHTRHAGPSFLQAAELLHQHQLPLPLRTADALDRIAMLIHEQAPYEALLEAFDVVRGAVTGPLERHALWVLAGYALLPSRVLFAKPSDEALSPDMERVGRHLRGLRRFREWERLVRCVEVLDGPFRRRRLPPAAARNLEEIYSTYSFFFCLVDGSLPASYTAGAYARVPQEVLASAPLRDMLCPYCLDPFHSAARCTQPPEPWDLMVARKALEEHALLPGAGASDDADGDNDSVRMDAALAAIDADDRPAKEFRKCELRLAARLILDRREPYCGECRACVGHRERQCPHRARRVLREAGLTEAEVRLDRGVLRQAASERARADGNQEGAYALFDAGEIVLGRHQCLAYPNTYRVAVRVLREAAVPLAAARYATDAVQRFLYAAGGADLLQHLAPLRQPGFPEVCLLCSSLRHATADCGDCSEEEWEFLRELKGYGLDLWTYSRARGYYDERLPFEHARGKQSLLRIVAEMAEDYAPGGAGRKAFAEANGLPGQQTLAAAPVSSSQEGLRFSQLLPPGANTQTLTQTPPHSPYDEEANHGGAGAALLGSDSAELLPLGAGRKRGREEEDEEDEGEPIVQMDY